MRRLISIIVITAFLLIPSISFCQDNLSGDSLLRDCNNALGGFNSLARNDAIFAGNCIGVLYGYYSLGLMYLAYLQNYPEIPKICFPTDEALSTGQLAKILVKYLENHPERLHENPSRLMWDAFTEAFPCS